MIIVDDYKQGGIEWITERLGNPGSSKFFQIIGKKGGISKTRGTYLNELFDEIMTGQQTDHYVSRRMKEASAAEQESRECYEFAHKAEIRQVALCYKDELKKYHCSPDGLIVGQKLGFETKDAKPSIQLERLKKGTLPGSHYVQVQGSIFICDYDGWVFQSYSAGYEPLTLIVEPDYDFIKLLEEALEEFNYDLWEKVREAKKWTS